MGFWSSVFGGGSSGGASVEGGRYDPDVREQGKALERLLEREHIGFRDVGPGVVQTREGERIRLTRNGDGSYSAHKM